MYLLNYIVALLVPVLIVNAGPANNGWASSNKKSQFIDHIHHLIKQLASNTPPVKPAKTTTVASLVPKTKPPASRLMETIAPPAVRPCFVRPAFCPATSDACSKSRCARLYSNGVRIGTRYYKRVKCRLNYCRETCGKAEWFADGRRLIGCSDSSSTLDQPTWSEIPAKGRRLDSRVLPKERTANQVKMPENGMGVGGVKFENVQSKLKRRSIHEWFGNVGETIKTHTESLGTALQDTFKDLNSKRKDEAVANASNPTLIQNLTTFVDKQLDDAMSRSSKIESEAEKVVEKVEVSGAVVLAIDVGLLFFIASILLA